MLRKEDVIEKINKMPLPYYMVKDFASCVEEMEDINAIPVSFIATQIIKLEKLVDYDRYENDEYDSANYHKLLALRELLDAWKKTDRPR